jgi:hypothetical protein
MCQHLPMSRAADAPAIDLGTCAEIVGRTWLQGKETIDRELAKRNVAPDDWTTARAYWTEAIDDEVARGGGDLVLAFAARFEASRQAPSPDLPAQPLEGEKESYADTPAGETPLPVRQEVPSYLQAQPQPSSIEPPRPPAPRGANEARAASAPSAPAASAAPPARVAPLTTSTEPLDLEHLRNLLFRGPTPFSGSTTPERLAELREEVAAAADASGDSESVPGAEETAMYMPSAEERKQLATLPFSAAKPSTEPGADETAMVVPSAAMREAIAVLPFAAAQAPAVPELTVEGYASLAAQLQVHGATSEVLSKFQVASLDVLREVHAEQERRFAADPSRRAYFEKLRTQMAQTLRAERR